MADTTKPEIVQLLRRINEGATISQTSLGDVLRLCFRLGRLLNNKELSDWAKAEAGGYDSADSLPDYRIFATNVQGTFLGPFGSSLSNVSIPQAVVEEEHRAALFTVHIMQSVGELELLVGSSEDMNSITVPWSGNTILYYQRKELIEGFGLNAAWKVLTTATIAGILEVIRARVLEFVLVIERELGIDMMNGNDNKTPLETPSQEKIHQIFNTTIHGGTSFAFGNAGTTNQYLTQVQPGDLQGLKEKLAQLGLTEELITDLDTALNEDADSGEQPGPHVQGWFGRLMIKAGQGTLLLASTAATTVVVAEVRRFLGLPPV
jgi:AbiTii